MWNALKHSKLTTKYAAGIAFTGLLVLLLYYVYGRNLSSHNIYFHPEPKHFVGKKSINISIRTAVRNLGVDLWENILFIHALIGCDTTFSLYGLGIGSSLKAFREIAYFREQAYVFRKADDCSKFTPESIVSAGGKVLVYLYKGKLTDNLDFLRYTMFCQNTASSKLCIKPEVVLPTWADTIAFGYFTRWGNGWE